MNNLWNDADAAKLSSDPVKLRVYSSRLLGQDPDLVLHGGGNTSVKGTDTNLLGDETEVLYVKGSGWDLATIEAPGFAPVKQETLERLAQLDDLSDTNMVSMQRAAMTDPAAPNPSVEAIMHAIIPFKFVDHTHADCVVTVTNTEGGMDKIKEIYGDRVVIIPYVMPGFILAQTVRDITKGIDWSAVEGMILLNHGIFSFHDDAKVSYERMINLVQEAEDYIEAKGASQLHTAEAGNIDHLTLARLRESVSHKAGRAMIARLDNSSQACGFSQLDNVASIATRGPMTPDHVIRTKRIPLIVDTGSTAELDAYEADYTRYFDDHKDDSHTCLDPAPRWAVWPGQGVIGFGKNVKDAQIVADINQHTLRCIQQGEALGGWKALPADKIFEVEYWELEQAKLKKTASEASLTGKVAIVTGAASGIGRACVDAFVAQGACVVGLDVNPDITDTLQGPSAKGIVCDVTDNSALQSAVEQTVATFGGIDCVVLNAGMFPPSSNIEDMDPTIWEKTLALNLTSPMLLIKHCAPYLKHGIDANIVFIASKNVRAPGPGASAYSTSKAGLTQLARVAALEFAPDGIRVNTLHPDAVFDTGIWTDEILQSRADSYGLTVDEYKTNNLLKTQIDSTDVADMAAALAGPLFAKTTGAQISIDGGNIRVI
jgi:rhamnose utilization protein RhaD (predicted bifunctional aldolase and dehydrogenase)/NAD(P)-dependent dehydrogenase (short-subunit alcohol dehydrogenase family)